MDFTCKAVELQSNNVAPDQNPLIYLHWQSWCRNQLKAPGEAGHEVMRGVGIGKALPPPPPMPNGHTAVASRPDLTDKQLKKLLKAQKKEAKHAKKAAKKVQTLFTRFHSLLSIYKPSMRTNMRLMSFHSSKSRQGMVNG